MTQRQLGFSTSIDVAQQQKYNTTSLLGSKRSYQQLSPPENKSLHNVVTPEILTCNLLRTPYPRCSGNEVGHANQLEASEIYKVNSDVYPADIVSEFAQRKVASTPTSSLNPLLFLSHAYYGLPKRLVDNFASMGVNSIYPWQSSCLLGRGLLTGEKNLVYTAPTGGGKSLVADVLMLKKIIEHPSKKAILVLPYVALVQEKLKWLTKLVDGVQTVVAQSHGQHIPESSRWGERHDCSIRVAGFFGGSKARSTWTDVDVAVCTIEKANSLINSAIEQCTIDDLGIIVLDELHMIDDEHRGYLIELMSTKILSLQAGVQIVGMSATLSNTELLAKWLNAKYYTSKYKPVPIEEFLVYDHSIFPASTSSAFLKTASQLNDSQPHRLVTPIRMIRASEYRFLKDPLRNAVVSLTAETVKAGYGVLVFCGGRQGCQATASLISETMPNAVSDAALDRRKDVINDLRSLPTGFDESLETNVLRGVAFHHAGLTVEEREIVANAYDTGVINVIVATCSLAAGINLPARRVILQGARMGRDLVGPAMLRQMRGRAGRKGKDASGESYLCCQKTDIEEVAQLLEADLPSVESSLTPEKRGIKRALLEVITVRLATHTTTIKDYVHRTLLFHITEHGLPDDMVDKTLKELIASDMIAVDSLGSYEATRVGKAVVASSLTPEDGVFVHDELQRAMEAFVLDGEMHVFYMFTPVQSSGLTEINWPIFRREVERLDESGLRVLKFAGVKPGFVNKMANSAKILEERTPEEVRTARVYRRFYAAFQLRDLCNEMPIHAVARKYHIQRGFIQNLAQSCEGFAAGILQFCEVMGWGMLKSVLEHMSDRLKAGARADLLELAKIPYVKSRTARIFWEHGMMSLRAIAEAVPKDLVPILLSAQPKRFRLDSGQEAKYHQKIMLKAEIIVAAANRLWERQQRIDYDELT